MTLYWPWCALDGQHNGFTNTTDPDLVMILPPLDGEES